MLQHILALTRISETPVASFIFIMAPSYVVIFRSCSSPDNTGFWSVWRHTKKTCVRLFQSYGLFLVQIYDCFYLADSCHSISSVCDNLTTCTLMRNGMKVIKLSLFSLKIDNLLTTTKACLGRCKENISFLCFLVS